MFRNISFTLRRYGRQKLTTALHIVGLTLGIAVCLLIGLFIRHELSFDGYHSKAGRIYRANQVWIEFGEKHFHYSTPFPLADAIRKDVTGIEKVTKVHHPFNNIIEINTEKKFKQDRVMMTDPDFFDVFDVVTVEGNARVALDKPYQAVLTESTAKKFFGNENAIGKIFKYNNQFNITVAAVIRDFPGNTHLPASVLLSFSTDEKYLQTSTTHYGSVSGGSTFFVLPERGNIANVQKNLNGIYDRTVNKEKWMRKDSWNELEIQPLSDVHFNSKYSGGGEWVKAVNTTWLWFFGSVGLAVLALACINFINLSTAQSLTRAKEVGVRKTIGAGKFQLVNQFLGEAFLLVFISAVLAIVVAKISLPYINNLIEKQISFDVFRSPSFIGALVIGVLFTSLMAGLYPAWIITKFQPATTLKSAPIHFTSSSGFLRKALVVTQFTISVCLLIALLLIGRQMDYMRNKNLGFNKDNILMVQLPANNNTLENKELFRNQLLQIPQVKDLAFSTSSLKGDHWGTMMSLKNGDDPGRRPVTTIMTDEHYLKLYDFKLMAGRLLNAADTNAVSESIPEGKRFAKSIVNEKLIKTLGFQSPEAAIGQRFWVGINGWTAEIVGVVEDFNTSSLHEEINSTLITQFLPYCDKAGIKIEAGSNVAGAIDKISSTFKTIYPDGVFEFNFLDEQIDALYKTEARLYALFKIFSALAMLISCLGLWGLVNFSAQRRVKEIGIRKVLGASLPNIVSLLTKDFVVLVSVAIAIASPLAYWGIYNWLQDFAFRTTIDWRPFVGAGVSALLIAIITVSFQAVKAGIANPVKSLRTE